MTDNVDIVWLCQQLATRTGLSRSEAGEIIRLAMVAGDLTSLAPQATHAPEIEPRINSSNSYGQKENFKLPPELWNHLDTNWENDKPYFNFLSTDGTYLVPYLRINAAKAYEFIKFRDPVMQMMPAGSEFLPERSGVTKSAGGAPAKINWEKCLIEAASWMYANGIPKTQNDLFSYVADRLGPDAPSLTQMKYHLSPLYKAFVTADQSD